LVACGARTGLRSPSIDGFYADAAIELDAPLDRESTDAPDIRDIATPTDVPLVTQLDGLRWELPCANRVSDTVCTTDMTREVSTVLLGVPGERYRVTARFRGVVEQKGFRGGTAVGAHWQIDGVPDDDTWNVYSLRVSSPPATFYVNRGPTGLFECVLLDITEAFEVDVGARVQLVADSVNQLEIGNRDAFGREIVVPGVPPAPGAYDGQFVQMDVIAVTRVR
jgi:hypothetical protein